MHEIKRGEKREYQVLVEVDLSNGHVMVGDSGRLKHITMGDVDDVRAQFVTKCRDMAAKTGLTVTGWRAYLEWWTVEQIEREYVKRDLHATSGGA